MTPDEMLGVLEVLDAVDPGDWECFCQRRALVSDIGMDERDIVARAKFLQATPLAFHGRRFDVEMRGVEQVPAVVIGALDAYENWLDLIAWPIDEPTRLATLLGNVSMLGEHQLDAASPWGPPVPVHRTAVAWLRAGCIGVVPIDPRRAARTFIDCAGRLVAEDDAHARQLAEARAELVDRSPAIVVAEPARKVAA